MQGGAETKQGEQPPGTAGVDRQRQLGGENVSLADGREAVEEEQQRVGQQRTKACVRRRQQLAEAQQDAQQAGVDIGWHGHGIGGLPQGLSLIHI